MSQTNLIVESSYQRSDLIVGYGWTADKNVASTCADKNVASTCADKILAG